MDFDGMEEYDFDGKMDFDGMEEYDFDGKMDFGEMDQNDEENKLEPIEESDISQEPDRDTNADNNDDQSSNLEQENESYENLNSESTSTVLICENREEEGENLQSDDQGHEEIEEINQEELDKEIEKELEEGVEAINQYLEEEAEFINAYQEMVENSRELDGERESEGEERLKTEEEWEKEAETAAYTAEQIYESTNEIEANANNEELSEINEELEIEKEAEQTEEVPESQLSDLQEEFEVGMNKIEQHQVEPLIEEALEAEAEPIVNEKELEQLQELDLEEQFQTIHFNEYIEELVEKQNEQMEQENEEEVEAQLDHSEKKVSELEEEFEEGMNEIEQHQVEPLIEEALETEPEPIVKEKELKQLQEMDLEEQFQIVHDNEYIEELVEQQEEEKTQEHDKMEQEKEKIEQKQEILHQSTYLQEELEEQEQELELEYEEKDEVEQHQVEAAIEEELETEPKPIIKEEELEYVRNFELEKQLDAELLYELIEELANKQNEEKEESEGKEEHKEISPEEKVAQIKRKLEIVQEINTSEKEEEELEPDTTFPFKETEEHTEEENKDHQQELEEILEQIGKIEQEALNEIKQKEEDSDKTIERNYEKDKRLYKQQTGKRPIYANQETKGFKQWLEQKKEAEKQKKTKQEQDLKEEQKNEEAWKRTLKNGIEEATEIEPELKSELKKLVEKYNELEKLIKKYSQLYNKAQCKEFSRAEKIELKSLIEALQKLDPIKIELFIGIREIKRYIDEQYYYYEYWNNQRNHRVFSHFFTQLSQRYKSIKEVQKKEIIEEILENWIEETSEEEISLEMKVILIEILENYNELEELASNFMKLYKKEQLGQISQPEKAKLRSLSKTLEKLDPINIELFSIIRAIKRYLNDQHIDNSSEEKHVNRILNRFFTSLSQKHREYYYLGKPLKDDRNIEKKALAKELVSNMKRQQIENLRELGYDDSILMEEFVLYKRDINKLLQKGIIKDVSDLIGTKGKIKYGFVGFTYRAIDKKTKFFQSGLSFAPHPNRLGWYLHDCIFNSGKYQFKKTGTNQIHGWIAEEIDEAIGLETFREKIEKGSIKSLTDALNELFDFEITGVFWDEKLVRDAENEQIAVTLLGSGRKGLMKLVSSLGLGYDILNPASLNMKKIVKIARKYEISKDMIGKGLNDPAYSGKSGNPRGIEQFIWRCAYYTALDMTYNQMYEKMTQSGFYKKSLRAFFREYRKWFGNKKKGRELFLNPIIERLMDVHGYTEADINRLYPLSKKFDKELFIHLIEENYQEKEIAEKMGWKSYYISNIYAKELILQEYNFIEQYVFTEDKSGRSFKDLQYYLIAQKILRQVMNNIPRVMIMENFEGGITLYKFSQVHKRVLHGQTFTDLENIARESLLNTLITDLNPSTVSDIVDNDRCWMSQSMIYSKFKEFYKDNPLVQRVLVKNHLKPLKMAKIAVIGTELEKYYKLGFSNEHILKKFNCKYTLKDIIEITKLIWDCNPDSVRSMLHTGVL